MAERFKLDDKGNCHACSKLSLDTEHVMCFSCNKLFHAVCNNATSDERVATKTTVGNFLLTSTKKNFLFFCDICVTSLEINKAGSDSQRITLLENKLGAIDAQLKEMTSMFRSKMEEPNPDPPKQNKKH